MQGLTLAVSAREQRRIINLETKVDRLDAKILARMKLRGPLNDLKLARLIAKQRAALAEWNRLRWPRPQL